MQSRGDSAATLDMLPALKGKEKGLCYAVDQQQQPQQAPSQHPQQHSHQSLSLCLSPADIYTHVAEGGEGKARNSWMKEVVLGIIAGAFISFGFSTCMIAAGQIPEATRAANPGMFNLLFGAYGFPVGLSMCIINGASLFTSNIAYMTAAFVERKSSAAKALWVVWLSYFTNLVGCLLLVHLMVTGEVFDHGRSDFPIYLAKKKVSYSFYATMTKGILCNWLVCMAVWQGNAAQDITGKLLGIWFPISAFVTSGYEHCIANMFVIPLAMRLGAPISLHTFLVKNLIPATLGNLIGGAVFVAMAMALSFGSLEKRLNAAGARAYSRLGGPKCGLVVFGAANAPLAAGAAADSCCDASGASDTDSVAARAEIRSVAAHPAAV